MCRCVECIDLNDEAASFVQGHSVARELNRNFSLSMHLHMELLVLVFLFSFAR